MSSEIAPIRPARRAFESTSTWLDRILLDFDPSNLEQLDRVALLNRTDTKFLLADSEILSLLPALARDYRVLDISGARQHPYRTVYFDTPEWDLYNQHRTAQPIRHKVRCRVYLDSGTAFLEVKSKDNRGRTVKHRTPTSKLMTRLTPAGVKFVSNYVELNAGRLRMVLRNEFARVTLVHRGDAERLTLDFGLRFDHAGSGFDLPGVAIAEVKQAGRNPDSPFLETMGAINEQPSSVSKYCVGVARLHPELDSEAFEPMLQSIEAVKDRAAE